MDPNRGDRYKSWKGQTARSDETVAMSHDLLRSATHFWGSLVPTGHEWLTSRYELIQENAISYEC